MKTLLIAGARPNFMKIAPIVKEIINHNSKAINKKDIIEYKIVHTGQHYDKKLSQIFFEDLGIPEPDINLNVGSASHSAQIAQIMIKFESVLEEEMPNWVIVVGDVNSTLACALVASKMGIKIAHIEAGLRSFDRTMPEEINRLITDTISDLLFVPSVDGVDNLLKEGISHKKIHLVGNIMIDTLIENLDKAEKKGKELLSRWQLLEKGFGYVTLHRPSNVDNLQILKRIITQLVKISMKLPLVFSVHPRTRPQLEKLNIKINTKILLRKALGYHENIGLVMNARFIITDSGGLQEETTFLRVPCLTLRPNTERPITIAKGSNRLTCLENLVSDIKDVLSGPERFGEMPNMWDGRTAERVISLLLSHS